MKRRRILLVLVCTALLATPVVAHVPVFASDNGQPSTAYRIDQPAKSWSIYDSLAADGVAYYELELAAGDRLVVGLSTPSNGPFTPSLVLIGPGLGSSGDLPARVTVPEGMGYEVIRGQRSTPEYEPFAPGGYYGTVAVDRQVEAGGRYLLAVYEPAGRSGQVGVAVGHEERFTPLEYATVPLDLVGVSLWEGDHPAIVFGPILAGLLAALAVVYRERERWSAPAGPSPSVRYALAAGAGLYLGTAAGVVLQAVQALARTGLTVAAAVTAVLILVPVGVGAVLLWSVRRPAFSLTTRARAAIAGAGVLGLATWAGVLAGPLLLLAVALAPLGSRQDR